jgi:hypothetical protein
MQDPQSLHKYLYVHGDPIQGLDPTGLSLAGNVSLGIALSVGIIGTSGAFLNSFVGLATGQADLKTAISTGSRQAFIAIGAALGIGFLGGYFVATSLLGKATLLIAGGSLAAYFGFEQETTFNELLFGIVQWWTDPLGTIRKNRTEIISASNAEGVPSDLVAAVLLAELWDYDHFDVLADDDLTIAPEKHSIGIAQLRIDNVRNWHLDYPEIGIPSGASGQASP